MPKSSIVESSGGSISNVLRNLQTETWEVCDSKDSKVENLDEMLNSGERELVESTSNRMTG